MQIELHIKGVVIFANVIKMCIHSIARLILMSQHYFDTTIKPLNLPVSVLAGYDYPTNQFFLVVERFDDPESDKYVYSNLNDRNRPDGQSWEYYLNKLDEIGIEIPDEMSSAVLSDAERKARNEVTIWSADGVQQHLCR